MLIFEKSQPGRQADSIMPETNKEQAIDKRFLRQSELDFPEVYELEAVRHYTRLSQKNFAIDSHFYPLGSCSMKYNPRAAHQLAMLDGFANLHPSAAIANAQGVTQCLYDTQKALQTITGMTAVSLAPMAGAQGEFTGVAMIRAYHKANGDNNRTEMLVPDAAHGTNPASATMCGYKVKELPTTKDGDVDIEALRESVGPQTAGIMLTNPSTLGIFERQIEEMASIIHDAGGLLYYDGANLNAILGQARPGDMGFDVLHLNLHKTFATPHGSGGPGSGPVAANETLAPFLPIPMVAENEGTYHWQTEQDCPQSIGRLGTFMGNTGVLLRAYAYIKQLGKQGLEQVSRMATLNANYMFKRLQDAGFKAAYPQRRASHEFIISLKPQAEQYGVTAAHFAKRLLDYGVHAPTVYFPLLVPECFLIEPTETESKQAIDYFVDVMVKINEEAKDNPELVKSAPHTLPVKKLDEVKAAKELDLVWFSNDE